MLIFLGKIRTALNIGIANIIRVLFYRVGLKTRLHKAIWLNYKLPNGPFFIKPLASPTKLKTLKTWSEEGQLFTHIKFKLDEEIPNWHLNIITNQEYQNPHKEWWKIDDFDETIGDIKTIWDLSRMDWVLAFSQRARNGDLGSLNMLNLWLKDWVEKNPSFIGPNWKCGQEASIRIINLACASIILKQEKNITESLKKLIYIHLKRIHATLGYAIAQDNNHGTSEAAALFIGGTWLDALGCSGGKKYENLGRRLLRNRALKLIQKDGSFSQYSLNYHRMVLDTFSFVEVWRKKIGAKTLSNDFYESASKATFWLYQMVCNESGEGPNLGANDGSLLLQLTECSYKDFRPSVQLAASMFLGRQVYVDVPECDLHLAWLEIDKSEPNPVKYVNCNFDSGGYKILRSSNACVYFRYPRYKFRPSQADAMHIDFWVNSYNILGDAGSYSYNSVPDMSSYFNGTASHNTVQFDDRDQMPKLGRFLFGNWLKVDNLSQVLAQNDNVSCCASYCDYMGSSHTRNINLNPSTLTVIDKIKGFKMKAILRWRLPNNEWTRVNIKNGIKISDKNGIIIEVSSDKPIVRGEITKGWKSLFYSNKISIPVLEVETNSSATLTTHVRWKK